MSFGVTARAEDTAASAATRKLIAMLQTGTPKQKIKAANTLGAMGPKAAPAVPYLVELIDSSEKHETLTDKLFNSASPLGGAGRYVMFQSQEALVRIDGPAVEPLCAALLRHSRSRVRWNAAIVLGKIKDMRSVTPLIASLATDKDYQVRMWSAEALGKMTETWSVNSLGNAVQALMEALKDRDSNVRQKAAWSLGEMKATEAVPALIDTLEKDGKNSNAGVALFMITGQRLGNDPRKWRDWWGETPATSRIRGHHSQKSL